MSTREERLRERAAKKEQRQLRIEARKEGILAQKAERMAKPQAAKKSRSRPLSVLPVALGVPAMVSRSASSSPATSTQIGSSGQGQRTGTGQSSIGSTAFGSGRGEPYAPQRNPTDAHQRARALMEATGKGLRDRPDGIPHALPWRIS